MRTPKLNRRRFQYSLRGLLLFVLLASALMAWFGARWRVARQQREAVAVIRALGGEVFYDYEERYLTRANGPARPGGWPEPPGPAWARSLLGVDFFADAVEVHRGARSTPYQGFFPITGAWLEPVARLPRLEVLNLDKCHISDAGLAKLGSITRLRRLEFVFTDITDADLGKIEGLSQLEELDLCWAGVTDGGLAHLQTLTRLRTLMLQGEGITDAGLDHLTGFAALRELYLPQGVTPAGVAKLHRALPKCKIYYGSQTVGGAD
jgi:hypothetical protein